MIIADGLERWEDRNDLAKQTEAIFQTMPAKLVELIKTINKEDDSKITCVIADISMGWALHVAENMEIRRASFWPASAVALASLLSFQTLIDDGIMNHDGVPLNDNIFQLSPTMPPIKPANLSWACIGDLATTKIVFQAIVEAAKAVIKTEWILCNSSHHLESETFSHFPQLLSIGPLLASNRLAKQAGHFWPEDSTCLTWLDQQPACSVIYIAFGSFTILDQAQFEELALGLELTNRPFLWVVRPGITKETTVTYPEGYMDRVGSRGRIVSWAPQQKVLSHPSVACFLSHCGWNSTLEGVNNGVPFMCWPYFADQFQNETYICDIWENGLALKKNKGGVITAEQIKSKVNQLLSHTTFKDNALALKEKAVSSIRNGGSSEKNLNNFIQWIKEKENHLSS
ncbi:UDP-glycosyltransferase 83A1-like isoform X2 [Cynara cardunculus var. scolymus]|uniref:UDP-glycosyltransferase 83A1-like isoform X2 n=1 Tax=Cynara cardunculus var. scolymus TaxID=59895 RepID=UPI000D62AFCF|nr:UDP-glycosyltransferase 83A1-like isoform X2 [Cynara cardunculus var. scolymus]